MEYNEQAFKEKANLKAMKVWLALIAIMTLSYGSDLSKGIYTATQYVVFLVMAWVPFAIGLLTLKLKGRATPYYKDVLALGYGFFYAYVVCITDSATAYAYILPLTSMLILFKDRSYMIRCAVTNEIVIVISATAPCLPRTESECENDRLLPAVFNAASVLYLLYSFCRPLK